MPGEISVGMVIDEGRVMIDILDLAKAIEHNRVKYEISLDYLIRDLDALATQVRRSRI